VLFIINRGQAQDAMRHNYPVSGHLRHVFTGPGEFYRQYLFAMDREELLFTRLQRDWVNEASAGESTNVAFGSTRHLEPAGKLIFVKSPRRMKLFNCVWGLPMGILGHWMTSIRHWRRNARSPCQTGLRIIRSGKRKAADRSPRLSFF